MNNPKEKSETMVGPIAWRECPKGVEHDTEIKELKRRMDFLEKAHIEIRDKLLQRPSWAVMFILALMASLCSGLAVFVITKL